MVAMVVAVLVVFVFGAGLGAVVKVDGDTIGSWTEVESVVVLDKESMGWASKIREP